MHTIIVYFISSFFILLFCAKISYKLKLVDLPTKRKLHSNPTVFTGGIAIALSFILSIFIFQFAESFNLILSMALLISIVGLIDDKYNLNVGGKLSLQIFPIFYLIIFQDLNLKNLGDYEYFEANIGAFAIPLTLICVLFLVNSFNYFDGFDGTLSFASISVLIILFFLVPDQGFQLFLLSMLIPISIFLIFNFSLLSLPKMFLGDSGSLLMGFIISFTLIYLANNNLVHPILLAWTIVIFVYEFLSINIIRIQENRNPFIAGHDHLHHILFYRLNSTYLTNFSICLTNISFFVIGYLSFSLISPIASLILYVFLFIFYFILRKSYALKNSKV